ncbi:MAG: putative transcriptional regulator [Motiliproteus sp.]|jgi:predicted transcriptional regulator
MRKTFVLTHEKIKVARLIEAAKHDVKKYLKRERNKTLPEGADYWDFDCKFGLTREEASSIEQAQINKFIDTAETAQTESFYLEILAKPGYRT